jgi:protein O-GlcNAc transferase
MPIAQAENEEVSIVERSHPQSGNPPAVVDDEAFNDTEIAPSNSAEELLQRAILHHLSGELAQAERLYRELLAGQPGHAQASHNLGMVALNTGHTAAALAHFQAALQADPAQAQYWLSCVEALLQAGQTDSAGKVFSHAVKQGLKGPVAKAMARRLKPRARSGARKCASRKSAGLESLQVLAEHLQNGRPVEAERLARSLTVRFPEDGRGCKALGVALDQQQRFPESLQPIALAARLLPSDAEAQRNLGNCLLKADRLAEAESVFRRMAEACPEEAASHVKLGDVLHLQGHFPSAEACYRRSLALDSRDLDIYRFLAHTLQQLGRPIEAEASLRAAIQIDPDFARGHSDLGASFLTLGRYAEAERASRKALELDSSLNAARSNRGIALVRLGHYREGERECRLATEIDPNFPEAYVNLGSALELLGRCREAGVSWRRALDLKPDLPDAHSAWLFCLSHDVSVLPEMLFAEHVRFGDRFETPLRPTWTDHANSRDPERRLIVGFVSGDFHEHSVMFFIGAILRHLSGMAGFALRAYSTRALEDAATGRLRGYFEGWRQINGLAAEGLAEIVRADGVDILIDLSGHTGGNRLLAFARKPAPIQCAWLGYLGTSGLTGIDYYFADRLFLPPGEFDRFFTEKLAYLPAIGAFEPHAAAPSCNPLPALSNGYVTFGSFARGGKLTREVIALWGRLLRALPKSKILLGAMPTDGNHEPLASWFAEEGITSERLIFHSRCGVTEYLRLHHGVDICLDPFPFTGATTTCHAMWMGVPTLTLLGATVPGRLGPAMLMHVGLEAFVTLDHDDFVKKDSGGRGTSRPFPNCAQA